MNPYQIVEGLKSFGKWYHRMELAPGVFTDSVMYESNGKNWDMIREVRKGVDYTHKSVLDLGTFDGMWAFEAEKLGSSAVVGADIWQAEYGSPEPFERFLFARRCFNSHVFPVTNGDVHNLYALLREARNVLHLQSFDIIQCLGLLYHLENPLLALSEIRRCISTKGVLLLETACWNGYELEPAVRLNSDLGVYYDKYTFWIPNLAGLTGMLSLAGFEIQPASVRTRATPGKNSYRLSAIALPK